MDLEQRLRRSFRDMERHAPSPNDIDLPANAPAAHGLEWSRMAAVAGAVAITIVGVFLATGHGLGSNKLATPGAPTTPPGKQPASFHGLQVFVPSSWSLGSERCGVPNADTVTFEDAQPSADTCKSGEQDPEITVVHLRTTTSPDGRALVDLADVPTTVDGVPARTGQGTPLGRHQTSWVLVVPKVNVVVAVEAPDATQARSLLGTAHLVPVDSLGCPDRLVTASGSKGSPPPQRLAPPDATKATLCRYRSGWLVRSIGLPKAQTQQLATTLNLLPTGVSRTEGMELAPTACEEEEGRGFLAVFPHRRDSTRVALRLSGCGELYASNGSRTTKINLPLIALVSRIAGYDGLLPGPDTLR